ncbi:MAG TPA: hypothetical protein VHS80_09940 [Chthoniobacterales bacterium]|nr:hypothetical protein [Chthoniobacterales bacterium]
MNRTIKAIMRHMVPPPARSGSTNAFVQPTTAAPLRRKPERKLRVVFAPPPLSAISTTNH